MTIPRNFQSAMRVNVRARGYCLLVQRRDDSLVELPLDVDSAETPTELMTCQRRIDELLTYDDRRPYISCISSGEKVLIGYGVLLPIDDDHGRRGVQFFHATLVSREKVVAFVVSLGTLLYGAGLVELTSWLSDVASGSGRPSKLFQNLERRLHPESDSRGAPPREHEATIGWIEHDCGGAVFAWVVMIRDHVNAVGPWEVFDSYERGLLVTQCGAPKELLRLQLSRCIAETTTAYAKIAALRALLAQDDVAGPTMSLQIASNTTASPTPSTPQKAAVPRPDDDRTTKAKSEVYPAVEMVLPRSGEVVEIDARETTDKVLGLRLGDRLLRISPPDIVFFSEQPNYFELEVQTLFLGLIPRKRKNIILFRSLIPDQLKSFVVSFIRASRASQGWGRF